MVSRIVFECLARLDILIDRKPHLPEEQREELIWQRDWMLSQNRSTAEFRKKTIYDFMRKKK